MSQAYIPFSVLFWITFFLCSIYITIVNTVRTKIITIRIIGTDINTAKGRNKLSLHDSDEQFGVVVTSDPFKDEVE